MIRSSLLGVNTLTVRNLNVYDHLICSGPRIQSVRWKRKPMWLPTAKSKLFRVPQRPVIPTEDALELKRLHNNYRTLMNSLNNFFIEREQNMAKELNVDIVKANKEKDFEICSYINEVWNKQVSGMRKERLAKERANREREIFEKLDAKKERDLKLQERADSEIRKAKEEAPTFITPENIDVAVEFAIKNIVNHDYAIDRDGKYYTGKSLQQGSSENVE